MLLVVGARLGPYEILSPLGAGGMGEVYRARDSKLSRDVAIKVISGALALDPDRLARFKREAQVLASLNHPHIAAIYGFEDTGDTHALVLELVEGETLADRIARGAIPLSDALPIARQIAGALEAAHEQGIIHRDLKPANIKITPDGRVKVLDFGLAKIIEREANPSSLSMSPTLSVHATGAGLILGTAAYMSPEQARGKPVDRRTDIWAFGCVLFEMLAGRQTFETGETVSDAVAAILTKDPDWRALPSDTPPLIGALLRRCLQKDPQRRLPHIGVARLEIDDAIAEPHTPAVPQIADVRANARWKRAAAWALGASVAVVSLALLAVSLRDDSPTGPVTRVELNLPAGVELFTISGGTIAVSPDGTRIAFVGVLDGIRHVYLRALDQFETIPLRGTENVSICFFSADGRSIGFITAGGVLKKVSIADGLVASIAQDVDFNGASWATDDRIVFTRAGALWQVPASGGTPTQLLALDAARHETLHTWPTILPGGNTLLFGSVAREEGGTRLESLVLATGERRVLVERATFPRYLPSGQLIFFRDDELLAAAFDAARLQLTGAPSRIVENVPQSGAGTPLADVSSTGTLVYAPTAATARLVWASRQGTEQPLADMPRPYANPRIARDGHRVLVQAGDLWIQDLTRATFTRLTSGQTLVGGAFPVWTPEGDRVVFRSTLGLRWHAADGSGRGEAIAGTSSSDYPGSISADGEQLIFVRISAESSGDIYVASLSGETQIRPLLKTPAYEGAARLSPDGRWIVFASNESGQMEVYLRPYPGPDQRTQVSSQGGTQPLWNPNGKEIFYRNGRKMMVVAVSAAPDITLSQPGLLFEQAYSFGNGITIPNYDVSADGQRFVMVKNESSSSHLNVVLNWFEELKQRVPLRD